MANRIKLNIITQPSVSSILAFNINNGVFSYTVGIEFITTVPTTGNKCQRGATLSDTIDNLYTVLTTYHNPSNVTYTNSNPDLFIDFVIADDYTLNFLNNAGGSVLMQSLTLGSLIDNIIHIINFTPIQYSPSSLLPRNYLITETDLLILTEDGRKIRL